MKRSMLCAVCLAAALLLSLAGCGERSRLSDLKTVTIAPTQAASSEPATGASKSSSKQSSTPSEQPQSGAKDAAWFNDAVFVGDSVTLKLSYYCENHPETLGGAQFFCAGSLGYTNALWDLDREDSVHPYYQGQNYLSQDCAKITGATKVFVMLGMNDIALYGEDGTLESARTLIGNIKNTSPDATIYIQSVTPMIQAKEGEILNNQKIQSFNTLLQQYCAEQGYQYLDIYSALADANGCLPLEYCGDPDAQGIHFTDAACELWATYLKENAI